MDDLISRQAVIDAIAKMMPKSYTPDGSHPADEGIFAAQEIFSDCIKAIEILPSAQPEIIRCKDCCHRVEHKNYGNLGESAYTCESNMDGWILPDGYCNFAKRREDGKID